MGNPATGPKSNSFKIWAATFIPSLVGAVTSFTGNVGGQKATVLGAGACATGLLSTLGKLFHDHGFNVATITAAGSDLVKDLPELRLGIDKTISFAEEDFPGLKTALDGLANRVSAVETKTGVDPAAIEAAVRKVLAGIAPPAPPAA